MMKSAPPSIRASTCSRIIWSIAASYRGWAGSGPIEPATHTGRSAASATPRAIAAPAVQISATCSSSPYLPQRHAVGPERVGRQHVGPGVAVVLVDAADQLGVGQAQLVEAAVGEHVVPIDLGAHGTVEHQHLRESFGKGRMLLRVFIRLYPSCSRFTVGLELFEGIREVSRRSRMYRRKRYRGSRLSRSFALPKYSV